MLNLCPIPPTDWETPSPSTDAETASDAPPPLWSRMTPASRQQLGQMIAELMRRIPRPSQEKEAIHEKAA
jgi:hypothetical protein